MINITIIGMDAVESLLDRLIAAGEDERAERIERGAWDLETALSGLEEAIRNAAPEEADMEQQRKWEPEEGETYVYFTFKEGAPTTARAVWRNGSADHLRARLRNVFENEASAWKFASGVTEDDR